VLIEHLRGAQGLLCLLTDRIDGEVMDAAGGRLRVISNHAVGFDNVDVAAATQRGIPVGNTPGILTEATADFAFLLMMAAGRRLVEADHYVRAGKWKTWGPSPGTDFRRRGAGFWRIGWAVLLPVHMRNLKPLAPVSKRRAASETWMLLERSDFISLHTPLNDQTYHLIDAGAFGKMKPNAVLINTSRGAVVDMDALHEALKSGRIFAAALDVTDPEPLPLDHPLFELDNLLISPHVASASRSTREKMASMAAQNLLSGLRGERLPNCKP
jgi:lactate dehydrogenase-like 2-hydroxyacid dehydrogenase